MAEPVSIMSKTVERLPDAIPTRDVTHELNKILNLLQKSCPQGALVSFDFDGTLQAHIDVRAREDVTLIQALLPMLGNGLFTNVTLGSTPHRPFYHRISAKVDR